jgi:hypothetical protein
LSQALRRLGIIDEGSAEKQLTRLNAGGTQIDVDGRQVMTYQLTPERVAEALELQLDEVA